MFNFPFSLILRSFSGKMYCPNTYQMFALLIAVTCTRASQFPISSYYAPFIPPEEWVALNQSVEGRLYPGQPVGLPCYNNFNGQNCTVNPAACIIVEKNKHNAEFLTTQMSGYIQVCIFQPQYPQEEYVAWPDDINTDDEVSKHRVIGESANAQEPAVRPLHLPISTPMPIALKVPSRPSSLMSVTFQTPKLD